MNSSNLHPSLNSLKRRLQQAALCCAWLLPLSVASASVFTAQIELGDVLNGDGSVGTVFTGLGNAHSLGAEVGRVGDLNGDGLDDFAIVALNPSLPAAGNVGSVYVLFGSPDGFGAQFDLSTLTAAAGGDGSAGVTIYGGRAGEQCCRSISAAGDVNGDGIDDLILGSEQAREVATGNFQGYSYLIFGRADGFPPEIFVDDLLEANGGDGSVGVVFRGPREFGSSVAAAGDFNADGIADLIVGAQRDFGQGILLSGASFVIFGRGTGYDAEYSIPTSFPSDEGPATGISFEGIDAFELSGSAVSYAGDINDDGISDVIIGAADADPGGISNAGRCYVVFGSATLPSVQFNLSELVADNGADGSAGFIINGNNNDDRVCTDIARAGDMNGDGIDDLLIGARGARISGLSKGAVYIVHGKTSGFAPELNTSELLVSNGGDGSAGVTIEGIGFRDSAGFSVGAAADVNADGYDDLLIGAPNVDNENSADAGEAYVVFGKADGLDVESGLGALTADGGGDGSDGFVLKSFEGGGVGVSVAMAGDVNGDGAGDFIVGASTGADGRGRAYLIYGRSDTDDDQVLDQLDNCVVTSNSGQIDTDGDGYGNACDADFNNDCIVNVSDLGLFRNAFFGADPLFDLSGDGIVNVTDLGRLRSAFFGPPGPSGVSTVCDGEARSGSDHL